MSAHAICLVKQGNAIGKVYWKINVSDKSDGFLITSQPVPRTTTHFLIDVFKTLRRLPDILSYFSDLLLLRIIKMVQSPAHVLFRCKIAPIGIAWDSAVLSLTCCLSYIKNARFVYWATAHWRLDRVLL